MTVQFQTDVRFGSKADICSAKGHVRFTPESGPIFPTLRTTLAAHSRSVVPGLVPGFRFYDLIIRKLQTPTPPLGPSTLAAGHPNLLVRAVLEPANC